MKASPEIKRYFTKIGQEVKKSYEVASKARSKGLDPEKEVSIPLAKNMAERVVGLISVVSPQIAKTNITERIAELEKEYGQLDWRVAFKISEEVAKEKFYKFSDKKEAIEVGIRVGFAYLTLGIVSAPLEGFTGIKIKKRKDGKEYFALQYAGPIRGAGGTAASTSVILADYVRVKMGYAAYDPDEREINRYTIEIHDYHERVTNLQYHPSDEELKFIVSHLPVEIDGDPTEKFEVSNYKDLPRIETNLIRGGVALVLAEGLCQKSPKLWKRLAKWGKDFDLDWDFLEEFIKLKEKVHAARDLGKSKDKDKKEEKKTVKANNTFIMDLVAGRPILTHPLGVGGFRLRYGRTRTSGFSAAAAHPATLIVLDKYIAIGTQLKMERPGKAATITVCDTIEGPIVRLKNGSVLQLKTEEEAKLHNSDVVEIVFLGDILFNYGDFSENGHYLVPAGYCPEWWALEVEKAINNLFEKESFLKAANLLELKENYLYELVNNPLHIKPSWNEVLSISKKLDVPLHPDYTFYWKLVSGNDILLLKEWLQEGKVKIDEKGIKKIILPYYNNKELHLKSKKILNLIGVPHEVVNKESVVLDRKTASIFSFCFDFEDQKGLEKIKLDNETVVDKDGLEVINFLSSISIKDKAGTFIGARMGRPEKAKMRHLTGSPQVMFPVGEEGGRLRSFQSAIEAGKIRSAFPFYYCNTCEKEMIYSSCEECGKECTQKYYCRFCGDLEKDSCRHGLADTYKTIDLDISYFFNKAKEKVGEDIVPDLIKGVRGTSNKNHVVEHLTKGILRAKHNIYVNKEGTTRYDCTELPITHFKPKEIGTSIEKLKEIGYEKDIYDRLLTEDNQILSLKPQDIILPGYDSLDESAPKVLSRVAKFIDELLVKIYGLKSFYKIKKEQDLVGHLVIGLAPHISAGMIGRIIGFSQTQSLLASPMFHAGLRRDCDGDEAAVMLLLDALLNFSRQYLPNTRGSTMDSPLVLTSYLDPAEVDDQVHGLDVVWKYPLEFYQAALEMKFPWEVKYGTEHKKIEQLGDRLGTEKQYEDFGFTHNVDNFNKGVQCSAYKTLPSMQEKLIGQMEIAKKVRAVDMDDVAKLVIQKHFLKDIKGNLRKFSMQQFRCVGCNTKYRRPPLTNKCSECGGKLIFTISHGSVIKYLEPSLKLATDYDFSPYLKQTLDLIKANVDQVFGKEKDKQVGLSSFIS
ncbi:MAG: DNA polymerase II large subunit [Nanoarchaeota archaeon]|nr:DNA polymerase II large subunit [Nanoarchaeota archaeon]MBU1632166.1 DNA polymerase II large subunit [Nanoarchaeota archaeon]MBU1876309.1 DNA polymerase II large subunit [Nanoarchaeota archaeon]